MESPDIKTPRDDPTIREYLRYVETSKRSGLASVPFTVWADFIVKTGQALAEKALS